MKPFNSALIAIRRSPYQSLLAIFVVTIAFFVGYTFSLMAAGTEQILKFFETRPQVMAFFNLETPESNVMQVAQELEKRSYVESVKVVTKQGALDLYREENIDNPLLLELVTADILPASIEVSAKEVSSLSKIEDDLKKTTGIEEVVFQQDIVSSLTKWTNSIRIVGLVVTLVLGTISFLTMMVIIGMKVTNKSGTIKVMKIIGATGSYILSPYLIEGIIYSLTGSLFGWLFMYIFVLYATPWVSEFLGSIITIPIPVEFILIQIGIGTSSAIILGSIASISAVQRQLKK